MYIATSRRLLIKKLSTFLISKSVRRKIDVNLAVVRRKSASVFRASLLLC